MEIYEGRTHVGELMWENGEIWRNMERFGGIWGCGDTRGSVDVWKCNCPRPSHYVNCKRFHKLAPLYLNIIGG